jgi:citrate lyase subunit beta/citryl-CoA lyase
MARRSVLFTPGDRPAMLRKAADTDADVLVFDLEDAVAPDRKAEARDAVRDLLVDPAFDPDAEVCVRLNPRPGTAADLDALRLETPRFDAVMLPKVGGLEDVVSLESQLHARGCDLPVFALLETAEGVLDARAIGRAAATDALVFGAEDLAVDVGATRTAEGTEVLCARQRVVLAAAATGVDAIDTVFTAFDDESGLVADTGVARQLGYDGKLAIHPSQVPVINDAFTPDPDAVDWARNVLAASEAAEGGVFAVDGEMIDRPLVEQAKAILDRAGVDS